MLFTWEGKGKTETETETLDPEKPLLVAPTTVPYLKQNWTQLMKGETLSARFAVLDRRETVGFKFFKVSAEDSGQPFRPDRVVIRMKPTSLIISALVKPLHFVFDSQGVHLLELEGRLPPKRKKGDQWKDWDYHAIYQYAP